MMAPRHFATQGRGGVTNNLWNIVFMVTAILSAFIGAYYYVAGVLDRDQRLARIGAAGFFLFSIAAVLYYWRFL
jgi:hypothetical protein